MGTGGDRWLAAVCVGVVIAAGCAGDDEGGSSTTTVPPSSVAATVAEATVADVSAPTESTGGASARTAVALEPVDCADPVRDPARPVEVRTLVNVDDRTRPAFERWELDFESSHPGIDIVLDPVDVGSSALMAAEASHPEDRPAIVHAPDVSTAGAIASGLFEPVTGCGFDMSEVAPQAVATYVVDGVAWAAPFAVSVPLLYYARELFTAAGLDPDDPPTTLDELDTTARALVASGVTDVGLVLDTAPSAGGSWYVEQMAAQLGLVTLAPDNGRGALRATSVTWDQPAIVDALRTLRHLVDDGVALVISGEEMDAAAGYADLLLLDDGAAMAIHTSGSLGPVLDAIDVERVGIAPMPLVTAGAATAAPGGAALWLTADLPDATASAAREWIAYLMAAEAQGLLAAENGYVPIVAGAAEVPAFTAAVERSPQLLVPALALADRPTDPAHLLPVDTSWSELRRLLATAVAAVLVDGADPSAALRAAEVEAEGLLSGSP